MTKTLTPPADLALTRLHSPAEQDAWKSAWQDYHDAVKAREAAARLRQEAAEADANRVLTREEYHAQAVQREAKKQAKEAARQAAEQAKRDEEAAYLASLPEVADVCEASEYLFLLKVQHWMAQGYFVAEDSISHFVRGCYAVRLHKPTNATRGKQ